MRAQSRHTVNAYGCPVPVLGGWPAEGLGGGGRAHMSDGGSACTLTPHVPHAYPRCTYAPSAGAGAGWVPSRGARAQRERERRKCAAHSGATRRPFRRGLHWRAGRAAPRNEVQKAGERAGEGSRRARDWNKAAGGAAWRHSHAATSYQYIRTTSLTPPPHRCCS
jgi:hypothetical protein